MNRQKGAAFILFGAALTAITRAAPPTTPDANAPRMKGTIEERTAAIQKFLADNRKIEQISMQGMPLETALHLLGSQAKIDIKIDSDALKKQGVDSDSKITVTLHNKTFGEVLPLFLWPLDPKEGAVGYAIEDGVLVIKPTHEQPAPPETDAQKKRDKELQTVLQDRLRMPPSLTLETNVDAVLAGIASNGGIDILIDWGSLEKAGMTHDAKLTLPDKAPTLQSALLLALESMHARDPVSYEIQHGIIKVSTLAKLQKSKPKDEKTP